MQNSGKDALSRRAFVGKLATGAAGAAVAFAATKGAAKAVPHADSNGAVTNAAIGLSPGEANRGPILDALQDKAATAPPPWQIMAPLAAGSVVAADWRIVDLTAVADGSCTLTLGNRNDRTHRVHLCRNGGEPRGLVYTEQFDLVVMNGGRGDLPTEEGFGLAVASVAHAIAANEASGGAAEVASALMTHTEREQRFADSARLR